MILSRLHPVEEAVSSRPRQIEWVTVDRDRRDHRLVRLIELCRREGVPVRRADRAALDRLAGGAGHQGVAARLSAGAYRDEAQALEGPPGERFLLVLDGIQDPQNLGAVLRVAEAAGAGVALPDRGSAPLSEAVSRSSAGAVERVSVYRVGNLRRFLDRLKDQGFRVIGLDPGGQSIYGEDLTGDLALVLGSEGRGMRRLVREGCDVLASLPMKGRVASLNVSAAAAAAAFEALRQRSRRLTP